MPLAQAAAALSAGKGNQRDIVNLLESLLAILRSTVNSVDLDIKLANYAFFPIAQLLRESKKLSIRPLELCLQCIAILIEHGWKAQIPAQLAHQIVILCSTLGEARPKALSFSESTDELRYRALTCLHHLFSVLDVDSETTKLLTDEKNIPQLGQTISVLLDGVEDGQSIETQLAAVTALHALVQNVLTVVLKASFLPGIVSRLTKVLTPQNKHGRRNARVLTGCLDVFALLLRDTVHDALPDTTNAYSGATRIDADWLQNAATQLKPALNSILRLKSHDGDGVQESLTGLCMTVLQECQPTLANCSEMILEALVYMGADCSAGTALFELEALLLREPTTAIKLRDMLYHLIDSLATVLQSHDAEVKASKLKSIHTVYGLLSTSQADLSNLDRNMARALRDGVVTTLTLSRSNREPISGTATVQSLDLSASHSNIGSTEYETALVTHSGQMRELSQLTDLANLVTSNNFSTEFTAGVVKDLNQSQGIYQLADFWLLLSATQALVNKSAVDDLLDMEDAHEPVYGRYLEDVYSFSLSILTEISGDQQDNRLLSLALRGLGLQARVSGKDFRGELVDALYPVLHTLATPGGSLQHDSITTLNIFTSACGYSSTKDLIVQNVDYLTNAVALKLNAFDVSPQAPQVLLMMIRLAGPSLLPYLEDTVDSIFAALEDYHGYPLLVELLFKVLSALAEEGVKAPQLALEDSSKHNHRYSGVDHWKATTIHGLAALLEHRERGEYGPDASAEDQSPHPQGPWAEDEDADIPDEAAEEAAEQQQVVAEDVAPPAPKTYNLLLKITELTQHFLPSSSASLRTSLLSLIKTTVPAVACHENSFLPLINTLWPEIVSRLEDEEPYTVASAMELVGTLCEYAGDFMRSRIIQLWPRLVEFSQSPKVAQTRNPATPGRAKSILSHNGLLRSITRGQAPAVNNSSLTTPFHDPPDTPEHLITGAVTSAVLKIVQYVPLQPEMLDEAFDMLQGELQDPDVRNVLERANADALWLLELQRGFVSGPSAPVVPEQSPWAFAQLHVQEVNG